MADTSTPGGLNYEAPSDLHDEPPPIHTQTDSDFSEPLTHTDKDKLDPGLTPSTSTTTTTTTSKRVTMDGDVDGAPTTTTDITTTTTTRGRSKETGSADGGSKGSQNNSSAESTPRRSARAKSANPPTSGRDKYQADLSVVDMKTSWDGSATSGGAASKGETSGDGDCGGSDGGVGVGYTSLKYRAGMLADPAKIAREREKEERVRQAREKLLEERRKKLEDLREQQRLAQENREKQLEMRRKKIEDLRRRDTERRAAVEERRKMKEEIERIRRESILQKAEERVARYEAWKAGGRKGGRSHVLGFGSGTPRDICQPCERPRRSSSHSALHRRSPNGSEIDTSRPQRRALSACSAVRRHCCVDINRMGLDTIREGRRSFVGRTSGGGFSTPGNTPSSHLYPGGTSSPVRIRERNSPRKQRPSSVATSMPSFVGVEPAKTPRSKSSDRTSRDRSKHKTNSRKDEKTPRTKGKETDDNQGENKDDHDGTTKKTRVSLSFFDRLATPKFNRIQCDPGKEPSSKKDAPLVRRSSLREKSAKDTAPKQTPSVTVKEPRGPSPKVPSSMVKSTSSPRRTPPPPASMASPQHTSAAASNGSTLQTGSSEDGTTGPRGINADISEEAYKAKLAEKRRQAREKAEKEAEEERKRQEEARLAEEERLRQEEEEQRIMEEESNRLAEEARKAEEERLQRAIEAEEKRKQEEAERLEQERKAKEESDRKAKEEAERLEKEKQERLRKEEEERQQRKKKLEMIMKRVKTDPAQDTSQKSDSPTKSVGNSPNRSMVSSPDVQEKPPFPETAEDAPVPETQSKEPEASAAVVEETNSDIPAASVSVTRSASSDEILEGATAHKEAKEREKESLTMTTSSSDVTPSRSAESDGNETTTESSAEAKSRFKSPLLQQLVENKVGDSSPGTPKFKSPLLQNLLGKTKVGARMGLSSSMNDLTSNKDNSTKSDSASTSPFGSTKEISKQGKDEDKDEDESLNHEAGDRVPGGAHLTNGIGKDLAGGDADVESSVESSPLETKISPSGMTDSALGASIEPGVMSQSLHLANGHSKDLMQDSSISLHSVDSVPTSVSTFDQPANTEDSSVTVSTHTGGGDGQFEELIDLLDTSSGKANAVLATGTPIIAFEENNRMTDVTESLS